jgi:molybdate transport system substrate-binding protein
MKRLQVIGLAFATLLSLTTGARAAEIQVAVAANFTAPAKEIAAAFKQATGDTAVLNFGSSGAFYNQLSHGAPYEVFLSADAERPAKAEQDGLAVPRTRFTYAVGRLVLYSRDPNLVDNVGKVLSSGNFQKLAIADPAAAPYGLAALQTLRKLGRYDVLKPKVVQGSSIAQTYQFVESGAAELGFVALSQVVNVRGGSRWMVPAADHTPIVQQAVLLYTGDKNPAARAFLQFLKSPAAVAIIRKYGYEVP